MVIVIVTEWISSRSFCLVDENWRIIVAVVVVIMKNINLI